MRNTINLICGLALLPTHLLSNTSDKWLAMAFILFLFVSYNIFQARSTTRDYKYAVGVRKGLQVSLIGLVLSFFFSLVCYGVIVSQNRLYLPEDFVGGMLDYLPFATAYTTPLFPVAILLSFLLPFAIQLFIPIPNTHSSEDILDTDELNL